LEEQQQRQLLLWRQQRINDYLSGQLRRYSHPECDRSIDKAARVAQGTLQVLYAVPVLEPLRYLLGSIDVLCRHGFTGLTGFLLRHDFVEAADMLMRISGFEKFPISVGELTACLYYKLALDKGRRGRDPDLEFREHCSETQRVDNADYLASSLRSPAEAMHTIPVHPYGEGSTACDADLDEAIRIAPLALCAVYQEHPADIQRLAGSQEWETLFAHTDSKPEQPAFVLFARKQSGSHDCHDAVLCIRGTQTVQDVVTDIRAAPSSFPPDAEVVAHAWRGDACHQHISSASIHISGAAESSGGEGGSTGAESTSGTASDWQWLDDSGATTKACGGISRASLWLLAQVGQNLLSLHANGYKLTVAGHSLGGAVGSLLTLLLKERIPDIRCWTYGSPCCVDKTLADQMKSCVTSVVLRDDAVSRFTPQSMRDMLRSLIASRSVVSSYLEQDWKDVVRRVAGWWTPRYRKIPQMDAAATKPPAPLDPLYADISAHTSSSHEEEGDGDDAFVLVEADPLLDLWLPGRVLHIYTHYGQCRASIVSRSYPSLRSIQVQANMFEDHRSRSIFDALLEARAVRRSKSNAPRWASFSSSDECSCCANTFTWHSTFNSQAQGFRDRHNCRQCGLLCCGPCSEKRRSLPRIGILFPVRICDSCYYKGDYAL